MEDKLQPIDLIARELSQKTIELANYKIAYNELTKELESKEKELKELKEKEEKFLEKASKIGLNLLDKSYKNEWVGLVFKYEVK